MPLSNDLLLMATGERMLLTLARPPINVTVKVEEQNQGK